MIKNATKLFFFVSIFILSGGFQLNLAQADSSAACAIWLCLPAGFPGAECSASYKEFKNRIKKGKSILPSLEGCSKGPNGRSSTGHYKIGYEYFEPCKDGYSLRQINNQTITSGRCERQVCGFGGQDCFIQNSYAAIKRPKPNFIKMWVDGQFLGQFFY